MEKSSTKKNVLIYGFSSSNEAPIINELKKREKVQVVAWINSRFSDGDFGNINHCRLKNYTPNRCPVHIYEEMFSNFMEFFFCRVRPKQMYLQKEKYYDYIDFFANYVNFFYDLLESRKVDVVFFANIPHLGPDFILFKLTKILGIKSYFFYQTLFPNKLIYAEDFSSLGNYIAKPKLTTDSLEIKNTFEKDLFYMHRGASLLAKIKRKFRWISVRRSAITLTYLIKFPYELAYKRRLKKIISHDVDFLKKYVYFAMHLQPEATTNPLGKIYADQALAIETLRKIIPEDWCIYVKENPYQDEFRRGRLFFDRIKSLPNTIVVPPDTSTYELLKNCQFSSTITGTVGWESISGGKNTLIFGDSWYDSLPGVFKFSDKFRLEDLLNYKIDHSILQAEFNKLYSSFANGIIGQDYVKIYPNFDVATNSRTVAELMENLTNF